MKQITTKYALPILLMVCVLLLVGTVSYAWFTNQIDQELGVSGSSLTNYFAGGDGTKNNPYIIKTDQHLYNLAWLQYIGYFNGADYSNGLVQSYFKLSDDIGEDGLDMSKYVLPPIGTAQYPFLGKFIGNNKMIKNLVVANAEADFGIQHPVGAVFMNNVLMEYGKENPEDATETAQIIGLFGVIGDYADATEGNIAYVTEKFSDQTFVPGDIGVENLLINNITVRTETEQSLIGILAGYVNGNVSKVGVMNSSLAFGSGISPLDDTYEKALSKYTLIGDFKTGLSWKDVEELVGGGNSPGFGGSIDMYTLLRRLTYMYSENLLGGNSYPLVMYIGGSRPSEYTKYSNRPDYTHSSNQAQTSYIAQGTVLPLNVDTTVMFDGDDDTTTHKLGSYSFITNNYYKSHSEELILPGKNTGYIVGGGGIISIGDSMIRMRVNKLASGTYPGIYYSLGTSASATATFQRENFQALTITNDGSYYSIQDDSNKNGSQHITTYEKDDADVAVDRASVSELNLTQYERVMEDFASTLTTGNGWIYGMRFYKGQNITDETLQITPGTNVSISGKTYPNYQFLDGAINFHLDDMGYITTVAGTYAEQNGTHHLFSIYKIARDENGNIIQSQSFEIQKVYVKYTDNTKQKLANVVYNDDPGDGYECVYDTSNMKNLYQINAAYYFEIPAIAGDYAITNKSTETGPYLMYLDIGANAGGDGSGGEEEGPGDITGVNFVENGLGDLGETYPVILFGATTESATTGDTTFTFKRTGNEVAVTPGLTGGDIKFEQLGKTSEDSTDDGTQTAALLAQAVAAPPDTRRRKGVLL